MTCSTTSAPWSNASTPGSRTNLALGSCACAAPSRSNAISCSASSPSPSIKYSACPRCKKLRVDQLAAQVSEKSRASQIMQEAPHAKKAKSRRPRSILLGSGFVLFAICGAYAIAIYGAPPNWLFAATVSQAIAGFASAVNILKASVEAITHPTGREEERSEVPDLSAATPRTSAHGASRPWELAYGSAAAQLYRKGDAAGLAALAKAASDADEGLALEWASLHSDAHLSVAALTAFAEAHPGWPDGGWIRRRREAQLLANSEAAAKVAAYFASAPPQTSVGMIAAARAAFDEGARIIRAL